MRFFIMGGGCYGTFYARQLLRARAAGALPVDEIGVVDSAAAPAALARLGPTAPLRHYRERWDDFLDRTLSGSDGNVPGDGAASHAGSPAGAAAPSGDDILVTPPFTPHLALAWLLRTLPGRVAGRAWRLEPFAALPATPFRHQAEGGPLLVSHADWVCPINCIEPGRCPRIRGPRDWDLDRTARELASTLGAAGQPVDVVELFHCHHVAYGVGGYPLARLPAAARALARAAARPTGMRALVGTISHCHGALHLLAAVAGMEREVGCAASPAQSGHPQRRRSGPMNDNRKTVLLVEDNEDNLVVYRTILEHVGYRVVEARDGEEGVARARQERPNLILMDISIPKIDGWEATQRLKADPDTDAIPIIALTAHALEEDRQKALQAGCDGYLAKPVEPRRVVQEVERFVGPPTAATT